MKYLLLGCYLILTISGLILMKKGGNPGQFAVENGIVNFGMSLVSMVGFICYLCSFLLFTRLVIMFDLSYIMPITTGIVQILTLVSSFVVFKEDFSLRAVIGASVVIIGIIIMNWKMS